MDFVPFVHLPILAFLRPNGTQPRSAGPPSSFSAGLQPVASNDKMPRNLQRRVSRTDLDFEQALRGGGTVMLTEGQDVNAFGADSPAPSPLFTSPKDAQTPRLVQPSTPVVVPPTPSPTTGGGASSSSSGRQFTPSPASSSRDDLFYDAVEDSERQTNRRSMYRSPGTSSSPDLATLLRKAKERGGVVGVHGKKEKRHEKPPPLPGSHDRLNGTRPRSSTSSHANGSSPVTPLSKGKSRTNESYNSPDWVLTSPRGRNASKDSGTVKARLNTLTSHSHMSYTHFGNLGWKEHSATENQCFLGQNAWAKHRAGKICELDCFVS